MKPTELELKLIAAARAQAPSHEVPFGFETRVMARLQTSTIPDVWGMWAKALWRSAGACTAVVVLIGAFSIFTPEVSPTLEPDLSTAFEQTMLAALDSDYPR